MHMHMADSLCCATETNTVLQSNYTPIKIYSKNKNKDTDFETLPGRENVET